MKIFSFIFIVLLISNCGNSINSKELFVQKNWVGYTQYFTNQNNELLLEDTYYNRFYKVKIDKDLINLEITDITNGYINFFNNYQVEWEDLKAKLEGLKKVNEDVLFHQKVNNNYYILNLMKDLYQVGEPETYLGIFNGKTIERIKLFWKGKQLATAYGLEDCQISYDNTTGSIYFCALTEEENKYKGVFKYIIKNKILSLVVKSPKRIFEVMKIPGTDILIFFEEDKGLVFYRDTVTED
ncbi:MAG: hypothetical protein HPY53_16750 [Brevinematales bacterium]|nr:hypothetical protein [Brevinematales bacterium]